MVVAHLERWAKKMNLGSKSRSFENYPRDIVDRVVDEYPADAIGQVHLWLEDLGSDRLSRCALFLARGSIEKLKQEVAVGRTDYRDLIVAAEYDGDRHVRNFNLPFSSAA
jgi:hypothetical protein